MEKSVQITLIIVAAIVVLALIGFNIFSNTSQSNTVSVNGLANVEAMPDLVAVYFYVETKADTAKEAKDNNAEIVDKVITALLKERFERKDIVTQSFSVNPNYEWSNGDNKQKGYIASHYLKIEMSTDETDKIGEAIDAIVDNAASLSYVNFELSQEKQNEYKAQALREATQDARIKAEAIAEGLGKKLGNIVSTSDSSFDYYPWRMYEMAAGATVSEAKQAVTDIQPGEQEIQGRVSVVYKLR